MCVRVRVQCAHNGVGHFMYSGTCTCNICLIIHVCPCTVLSRAKLKLFSRMVHVHVCELHVDTCTIAMNTTCKSRALNEIYHLCE